MLIGGSGSASLSATTALITQVQFLNLYGRVGGSQGSAAMQTFSDGMGEIVSAAPFWMMRISLEQLNPFYRFPSANACLTHLMSLFSRILSVLACTAPMIRGLGVNEESGDAVG
jgi:hypothetical protein